jgi:putative flippase GtrA
MATGKAIADLPPLPKLRPTHPDAVLAEPRPEKLVKLLRFGVIGVASTVITTLLYVLFRHYWSPGWANLAALAVTLIFNTEANRRWTFNRRPRKPRTGQHARAGALFILNYAISTAVVTTTAPHASRTGEALTLALTYVLLAALRFIALDRWVFPRAGKAANR